MNDPKRSTRDRAAQFVGALRRSRDDRGKLAALRHGLSANVRLRVDAWPVVAGLGGNLDQEAYMAVAVLFACHPEESKARNFGETCLAIALAGQERGAKEIPESTERRFRRLLACGEVDDVVDQLRSWVRLAGSKGVGVNYEGLFADLWHWPWYADDIRVRWARSFWQSGESVPGETPSGEANTNTIAA